MTNRSNIGFLTPKPIQPELPLFVYLPGMDCTGELLTVQAEKLAKVFDLRCLYISPTDLSSWEKLTEATIKLIQKELIRNPQRTVYLCGESFGGCLALKLMEKMPNFFTKVILVNSASAFHQRPWLNFGTYITQIMPDFIYRNSTLLLLPFLAKIEALTIKERQRLLNVMTLLPPNIVSWRINLLEKFAINQHKLKQYEKEVLIIAGGEDKLLPSVEEATRLKSIFSQAKISILTHSGHCCLLEKNVDLCKIITES
jgi:pimeloyl-ACP methyl ester carboxylesterase